MAEKVPGRLAIGARDYGETTESFVPRWLVLDHGNQPWYLAVTLVIFSALPEGG